MEGNYPDSVSSSPRSRETDSDYFGGSANQRWEAIDQSGSSIGSSTRVRLMCSCGGKILPRPHDNQLAYVGGDTRILAVERSIRFGTMISKLSNVWGSGVSFKYQLPNEDLDSLISVTNDEDLDNMMAEYDRLQKSGYKFSRLRLFVFTKRAEGSTSSLGSVLEESRREQWFVEALNNPPVNQGISNRSDVGSGSDASAWVNHMPDYLFGLENNSSGAQNNGGVEEDRMMLPRPNSFDSDASGSNRPGLNSGARVDAPIGASPNPVMPDQSEKGTQGTRNSNSAPIQEIGIPAPQKPNLQPDEMITQRPPAPMPQQVPLQEFQNLQLKHQQQENQLKQQEHQLKQQEHQIKQQHQQEQRQEQRQQQQEHQIKYQHQQEQRQDQRQQQQEQRQEHQEHQLKHQEHQIKQQHQQDQRQEQQEQRQEQRHEQQEQRHEQQEQRQQQQEQEAMQETFMKLPGRKIFPDPTRAMNLSGPGQEVYMQQPSQPDYYRQDQQQQQQQQQPPVTYWQMHDQGGNSSQYPVYLVPTGSNMMQTMTGVRPTPGYYNPAQRVTAAPSVYDAPGLVTTVRATVPRQQIGGVSEAVDPYREVAAQQSVMPLQAPPVSKVPAMYGGPMQVTVPGDVRMMYRAPAPVNSMPIAHPESYAYPPQQVVYDPNLNATRQVYYTQAVNTQYHQPMGPIASDINVAASTLDMSAAAPEQQAKLVRVTQATS
ncbi:hypothetical protein SUGI_0250710 [Cryptomeria japonica]|nr:hypothetical protein SUGI_0250710 [Cryptomeria japonica]